MQPLLPPGRFFSAPYARTGRDVVWRNLSISDCDRLAWEAIRGWPTAAAMPPGRATGDTAALTRWFLWDKVGRAIRAARDHGAFALERDLLGTPRVMASAAPARPVRGRWLRLAGERLLRRHRVLYCPFPTSRHARIIEPLIRSAADYVVVVPARHAAAWPGSIPWACRVARGEWHGADAVQLGHAIGRGLRAQGIVLLEADMEELRSQLREQSKTCQRAERELDGLRPDALLVPADNHPPFIEYVLAARARGIPAIMLQHGLDCERHYLDEAYASHIACWGEDRARRYRRDSVCQPAALAVVGNPHYDEPHGARFPPGHSTSWLWVTRPHRPEKCYAPSRQPDEGLRILDALVAALHRSPTGTLVIKPHPFDYPDCYRARLREAGMDRVRVIDDDTVENLLARAGVVISEDSTAGMDAMRAGRVVVHAHLASSPPVMPFAAYGAALSGFSPEALIDAVHSAGELSPTARAAMRDGQQRFLDDFAGPRDGEAAQRFAAFVESILNKR